MFPRFKSTISRSKSSISFLSRSSSSLSFDLSSLSSNDFVKKTHAYKVSSLYEIEYFPNFDCIHVNKLPFLNPYYVNRNPLSSFPHSIKTLIHPPQQKIKEYVQCSRFNVHQLPATLGEQFVQIEIPDFFISSWNREGFTYIYFGGIRFALTYHARKRLPVTSRIALVDTRFFHYEHACIGIVQTTFNVGTIMVTMFPNFCMHVNDPQLSSFFKFQVRILGAVPDVHTFMATLHYQLIYQVQNQAMDVAFPNQIANSIFINMESDQVPSYPYILKQITKEKLKKLILSAQVTNYE